LTFQDRYNKPDSAIPPVLERLFYMVFKYLQESFDFIEKWECVLSIYQKVHTLSSSKNDLRIVNIGFYHQCCFIIKPALSDLFIKQL
jgi:hypothetical protein